MYISDSVIMLYAYYTVAPSILRTFYSFFGVIRHQELLEYIPTRQNENVENAATHYQYSSGRTSFD